MSVSTIKENQKGSFTIEAAIIIPLVMCVCLLIFSLSTMAYTHSRVQHILNQVCVELSYDSYMFYELGIIDSIQDISAKSSGHTLTMEEIRNFGNMLASDPIESIQVEFKEVTSFSNPIEFVEAATSGLEVINKSIEYGRRIKDTMIDEGLYYVTTTYGRSYVNNKLSDYFLEAGIDIDFKIEHLELFTHDDSGVVVISYDYEFPFKLLERSVVKQVNSSYLQLFNGQGNYNETYHKDLKTSTYGYGEKGDQELKDEDGFYKKVYVTEHGAKYHKNPVCFHIKVNAIPSSINMVSGKKACSHCVNESSIDQNVLVFTTIGSDVYHSSPTCYSIYHNISILSEKEALLKGFEPCGTCSSSGK